MSRQLLFCTAACLIVVGFAIGRDHSSAFPIQQNHIAAAPARLSVGETLKDLGNITDQRELDVHFVVRNIGGQRLVINPLDSGCACSNSLQPTMIIPPGGSASLAVKLDTRFASGRAETTAAFACNDPAMSHFTLVASAFVTTEIRANPVSTGAGRLVPDRQ